MTDPRLGHNNKSLNNTILTIYMEIILYIYGNLTTFNKTSITCSKADSLVPLV